MTKKRRYKHDKKFLHESYKNKLSYNTTWMGLTSIQYPQDLMIIAEILHKIKPKHVIETGLAHGGTTAFIASILKTWGGAISVVEISPLPYVVEALTSMFDNVNIIVSSSIDLNTTLFFPPTGLVILDSDHSKDHVLKELLLYQHRVTADGFIVVCDTCVDTAPKNVFDWAKAQRGCGPSVAITNFFKTNKDFVADTSYERRYVITSNPGGVLRRRTIRDAV